MPLAYVAMPFRSSQEMLFLRFLRLDFVQQSQFLGEICRVTGHGPNLIKCKIPPIYPKSGQPRQRKNPKISTSTIQTIFQQTYNRKRFQVIILQKSMNKLPSRVSKHPTVFLVQNGQNKAFTKVRVWDHKKAQKGKK